MPDFDYDIGIIGGGAAGLSVASGAAQLGARTLLIEKEKDLGGDCLHFGCVPSKTLIRTARVYHLMKRASEFGLPPVDLPPVDFRDVRTRIRTVIGSIQEYDSEERFCSLGARVMTGTPFFTDEHTVTINGICHSAQTWVVATGSSPSIPQIDGIANTPYLTNKEIFFLDRLPGSMVIIGAGPVAVEMAQAFCRLGTRVTIVQRGGQILSREDKDMADMVMGILQAEGITFHLNAATRSMRDLGMEREVVIDRDVGGTLVLRAEQVLIATGRDANLSGLGLERVGVQFDRRGLMLDRRLRTSQPHIYGAGDVTGDFQLTHAAGYEAGIVLSNAVFRLPRKADYTSLPWCTYTDPEMASIGLNEKRAAEAGLRYTVWTEEFSHNDRALAEGERFGRVKMLLDQKERPIGVQMIGPHAGELISEWVAIVYGRLKLSQLAAAVHPYPTLAEINKRVAGQLFAGKLFSDRVRKGLKLLFNLKGRACG